MKKKYKVITMCGIDGAGKNTQVQMLKNRSIYFESQAFPLYGKNVYAELIKRYLQGELGEATEISPYLISPLFALDRATVKGELERVLKTHHIITDRYVVDNMAHQGSKIKEYKDRLAFYKWVYNFEHNELEVPKSDIIIYLNVSVPTAISHKVLEVKGNSNLDLHERNREYLKKVHECFFECLGLYFFDTEIIQIQCEENGVMRSRESIHEEIYSRVECYI